MFDGTADQFHRLIASRTEASSPSPLQLPLPFTHRASTAPPSTTNTIATTIFPGFDLYLTPPQLQHRLDIQQPISQFLHQLHHHQLHPTTPEEKVGEDELVCIKPQTRGTEDHRLWNNDEVLALFRTRSSIENWFPEVAWEHVSRKLEELGFKRSPQECKEKFEEGSGRFYDGINDDDDGNNFSKNNFRILSELEEICQGNHSRNNEDGMEDRLEVEGGETVGIQASRENRDCVEVEGSRSKEKTRRKRQRQKFEMFKRFCEEAVERLMVQQEEMHNKLLEDLARRDQEMVAREEERKKQEMDRINKELDERASEQVIAGDRQATVIELLQKFTTSVSDDVILLLAGNPSETGILSSMCGTSTSDQQATTNRESKDTENAAASLRQTGDGDHKNHGSPTELENHHEANNKRWPREEVEALINLRCNMDNLGKPGQRNRPPLWERVSKGMMELGYKRSAKRCKEKWENVNKYFRKTKDVRKKRSSASRTCPYFRQLSSLYGGAGGSIVTGEIERTC
ncbi:hypothetical protein MLD38_040466 [Melastoma candidum]|nr:hypothetical protein MLD38_040466 [Melastoma candidum]